MAGWNGEGRLRSGGVEAVPELGRERGFGTDECARLAPSGGKSRSAGQGVTELPQVLPFHSRREHDLPGSRNRRT
jgi:hypothetical protein